MSLLSEKYRRLFIIHQTVKFIQAHREPEFIKIRKEKLFFNVVLLGYYFIINVKLILIVFF